MKGQTLALSLSLSLLFIAITVVAVDADSWTPIKNLKGEHVLEIAEFAVSEHKKLVKSDAVLQRILKGESQVGDGTDYRLDLEVKERGADEKYQTVVNEDSKNLEKTVTSFAPHNGHIFYGFSVACGYCMGSKVMGFMRRGEDTRKNFTDHLYSALIQAGIHTFRDDDELPRGGEISPQLVKAIEGSRISIVVFSKGYASSRWCLEELLNILKSRHKIGQVVLPIFYDVDPSDVRKQTGNYAEAFDEHSFKEETEKVNKWREALAEAGNLAGWGLKSEANGIDKFR
ncbi:unnamed protein product [Dovyalis caffra]|uniref:TIR domain-containing protein n=1 Tax=Dovyalis caffra TaxID=77055 RepID=A0AAV1QPH7_9ROSI|nr:unnamed protein product [Dovyalis caffra]CAK7323446.1 unnamed protein product [Dovyalis caffra]